MMLQLVDWLIFTCERLWQHRVLVLWTLVGLVAGTTLALSLVLYVDAVNTRLLTSRLADPPYAFRYRYLGSWNGAISQADITAASAAIENGFTLGMPIDQQVRYLSSGLWPLRLANGQSLGNFAIGELDGAESQMTIVAGEWPAEPAADGTIPVLVPETMLYSMGLQVGDTFQTSKAGDAMVTLRVAALWRPIDASDPGWIFPPRFFNEVMLVDDLWSLVENIERPVEEAAWYLVFDGHGLRTSDIDTLLSAIANGERTVTGALPGIRLDLSPVENLTAFTRDVEALTQQLVLISLPVAGLLLYFVSLVAGLLVSRQQSDDAVLRSRGMSASDILFIHGLMWLILAGLALAAGLTLCPLVVRLVGQTTSFLRFEDTSNPLQIVFTSEAINAGVFTALLAAGSGMLISWRSSRQTITNLKRTSARAGRAWWQRLYLDVLLLIPAVYLLYTLGQRGGVSAAAENPFADPLTFLAPTLFSLSLMLLFLRLWPMALRFGSGLVAYGSGIVLLMALRELTRSVGRYRGTLLMMGFTLSLTGFTASMASTIDQSLADTIAYRIGADAVMITAVDAQTEAGETDDATGQTTYTVTGFNNLPADDLLRIEGVQAVSRVGRYNAQLVLPSQRLTGTVLGIDRAAMAAVTRYRSDYADESLADLFNRLAGNRNGIIISAQTARDYNLRINQQITLQISALETWYETTVPILGVVEYFPTLDPNAGFFAITSLDPIFELVSTELPYDFWLRLAPDADFAAIQREAAALGYPVIEWQNPVSALKAAQASPSRRGVLGFLSVGFVAAIVLTLIGAVIQITASFRAQSAQLGSLRAMGLSSAATGVYLLLVQGLAASSGILSGTTIGVATTLLFLPLLDFSSGLPSYFVSVAWDEITLVYAVFSLILFAITVFASLFLSRERLSTVVKLGDA